MIFVTILLFLLFNILSVTNQDSEFEFLFPSLEEALSEEEGYFESNFEGETDEILCSTLDECHQIIQKLTQENLALKAKCGELNSPPEQETTTTQDSSKYTEARVVKNTFLASNVQGNQYKFSVDSKDLPATFYIRAIGTSRQYPGLYVTADCDASCFESSSFTQFPSSSMYCWSGTNEVLAESTFSLSLSSPCTIYYSIWPGTEEESVETTIWLYKPRMLANNSQDIIFFPFNNTERYFVDTVSSKQVPSTFYIRAVGKNRQRPSIYVSSNCSSMCFDSTSFTEFPSFLNSCETGTESGLDEATYSLSLNTACKIYYSILSGNEGESVTVSTWLLKTATLSYASKTSVFFPFKDSIRYFVQNIEPTDAPSTFYIQAIGNNRRFPVIYVTADCIPSCFESDSFTNFPTYSSYCWMGTEATLGETTYSLSVTKTCKIYYAISSSEEGESVQTTVWLYKTEALDNKSSNSILFPFKNSGRYFVQNIGSTDVPSTFYIRAVGSNRQRPTIYVTADCISSCFETTWFTEFPSSDSYCETGGDEALTVSIYSISLTAKCKIYYSIWSNEEGKSATVNIWMKKSD